MCLAEVAAQVAGLRSGWMDPEPRLTHMMLTPGHTEVRRDPFGVVLVVAPFNYPMMLSLVPLVGAVAAGNVCVLKPSEQTTACERWFLTRLAAAVSPDVVRVVGGDVPRTTALLALSFDFIFFTGSPTVGRIVSRAAAEHLTPTVMELGGKAPVVVDASVASVDEAARRIVLGKFINAGQTCMAPDYVLVHESRHAALVAALVDTTRRFYGPEPRASPDYGRMCTAAHAARACALIEGSGGVVRCGGAEAADPAARYVPPTVVDSPDRGSRLMTDEVFGPVLSVLPFAGEGVGEAVRIVNEVDPQPLALYVFSTSRANTERLLAEVQSGDAMINDTFMHSVNPHVPFGGVGRSGHGTYRGRLSFETFTYQRGVLWRHGLLDIDQTLPFNVRYPPSGKARAFLLPNAVALFPCVPRIFVFRPRLFAWAAVAAAGYAALAAAEAAGEPPFTYFGKLLRGALGR